MNSQGTGFRAGRSGFGNKFNSLKVYYCMACRETIEKRAGFDAICMLCKNKAQKFDSKSEFKRYMDLHFMESFGEISELRVQVRFPIEVNGHHICTYVADFCYKNKHGEDVVEDRKGFRTDVFKLKKALMLAVHGINVVET